MRWLIRSCFVDYPSYKLGFLPRLSFLIEDSLSWRGEARTRESSSPLPATLTRDWCM